MRYMTKTPFLFSEGEYTFISVLVTLSISICFDLFLSVPKNLDLAMAGRPQIRFNSL